MNSFGRFLTDHRGVLGIILFLSCGFLFFSPWLVLLEIVLGVTIWSLLKVDVSELKKGNLSTVSRSWWIGMLFLIAISRLFPFLFSEAPLGYDTGLYRYELWSSFQHLPAYVSQVFLGLPLLTNVFSLFGWTVESLISAFYVLVAILLPMTVVMVAERWWGRKVALAAGFLFLISIIQWKAYGMFLFKQELAIALIFFTMWLVQQRSWLLVFGLAFLALLQPLDAFFVGMSLLVFALIHLFRPSPADRRFFSVVLIAGILSGVSFLILDADFWSRAWQIFWQGILDPDLLESSLQEGVFLSLQDYGYQSALLFVGGLLGMVIDWRFRGVTMLGIYTVLLLLWIACGLFFYQRLLIQLDAVLILYTALTLFYGWRSFATDRLGNILSFLLALGCMVPAAIFLSRFSPTISALELQKIQDFCGSLRPSVYVAATDSFYGPWLRGYCLEQKVFGPGLFVENRWSRGEWEQFWKVDSEFLPGLLQRYEAPVYFYIGEKQPKIEFDSELFEWVEGGWWRWGKDL